MGGGGTEYFIPVRGTGRGPIVRGGGGSEIAAIAEAIPLEGYAVEQRNEVMSSRHKGRLYRG